MWLCILNESNLSAKGSPAQPGSGRCVNDITLLQSCVKRHSTRALTFVLKLFTRIWLFQSVTNPPNQKQKAVNAFRLSLLIFLFAYHQPLMAGESALPAEPKTPQVQAQGKTEQQYLLKKTISSMTLNNLNTRNNRNMLFNSPVFYRPRIARESSDWILLRTNVGHIANLSHMIFVDIININIPCASYTPANRIANPFPGARMKKRDVTLISAISALSITALVLAPIINCITGSLRYNNSGRGTYAISLDMDNGLGLVARF